MTDPNNTPSPAALRPPAAFRAPSQSAVAVAYGPNLGIVAPPGSVEQEGAFTPPQEVNMTPNDDGTAHVSYRGNIAHTQGGYVNSPAPGQGVVPLRRW